MSDFSELNGLRIGCVRYLNSKPLIHAYPGPVYFDHPSVLALMLAAGDLDLALIPIFEAIRTHDYRLVDEVAIASLGAVYSVFLAFTGDLNAVRKIKRDPASLTSVNLLEVLLREFHGIQPELVGSNESDESDGCAQLLIGNQAIEFRRNNGEQFQYLDLGQEWMRCTGLPFVFAAWALRRGIAPGAADAIRRLKAASMAGLEEIIGREADPAFARDYLTQKIRFGLGEEEKRGISLFSELLEKHGLCAPPAKLEYV